MSIYIPQLYEQLPHDVCHHIMKYVGNPPTAKLLETKCKNYKYYKSRYCSYIRRAICKMGFYSYIKFKHNKYLSRQQQYDLMFANWLYENPQEKVIKFVKYYHESSISTIVDAEDAGVGEAMVDFIGGNTPKFIICYLLVVYINNVINHMSYINYEFEFIDLLRMYEDNRLFVEEHLGFFRNCEFEKIYKQSFIDYAENNAPDSDIDDSDMSDDEW